MPYVLDIETSSPTEDKSLALDPHRGQIDLVGWTKIDGGESRIYEGSQHKGVSFKEALIGHNLKFDLKFLSCNGHAVGPENYFGDTMLMASTCLSKVPEGYLENYEEMRKLKNKALPKGHTHREAGRYSLKVLAPYFLGVEPFWENPQNHNDIGYLKKDLQYTKELYYFFLEAMLKDGTLAFYEKHIMPWARMTLACELEGILLDQGRLGELEETVLTERYELKKELNEAFASGIQQYKVDQEKELEHKYRLKLIAALHKIKKSTQEKRDKTRARYESLRDKAIEKIKPFNFASPTQLTWMLRDHKGYDISDYSGEESTGVDVLEKLANEGKKDCKALLDWRGKEKLLNAFIRPYQHDTIGNRLFCSFNINGARTGRLSSSNPNLQQVPAIVRSAFVPADGMAFIDEDLSAIEPRLVAYLTEDETLCKLVISGEDFHGDATLKFFKDFGIECPLAEVKTRYPGERYASKQGDLSIIYGSGWRRFQATMRAQGFHFTEEQSRAAVTGYRKSLPGVMAYREQLKNQLLSGGVVENIMGRKFCIPNDGDIHLKGLNTMVQGSASDMLLQSVLDFLEEWRHNKKVTLKLLVHDQVVIEAPREIAQEVDESLKKHLTKWRLETKYGRIPLMCEGGVRDRWGDH